MDVLTILWMVSIYEDFSDAESEIKINLGHRRYFCKSLHYFLNIEISIHLAFFVILFYDLISYDMLCTKEKFYVKYITIFY